MVFSTSMTTDTASASRPQARSAALLIRRVLEWGRACIRRSQERAELRQLDLRERQDLGHSRVSTELGKPFWKS